MQLRERLKKSSSPESQAIGQVESNMSNFSKLKLHLRRWGWLRTAYFLILRVTSDFLGLHIFAVRTRLATIEVDDPCEMADLEFRRLDNEELVKWADDAGLELGADFLCAARERDNIAFGALDESLLIGYVWRSTTSVPHTDDIWVRVERPYCYTYNSYTRPAYRGNHVAPALILFSDQEMLKLGYTHRAAYVALTNFSSLRLVGHMDSQHIGYAGYLHWFGRHFPFRSRSVKAIGFEFFEPGSKK